MSSDRCSPLAIVAISGLFVFGFAQCRADELETNSTNGAKLAQCIRNLADQGKDPYPWLIVLRGIELTADAKAKVYGALLQNPRRSVRLESLATLASIGFCGESTRAAIIERFEDPRSDIEERIFAARAMGSTCPEHASVVVSLTQFLQSDQPESSVAKAVIEALGNGVPVPARAAIHLEPFLDHDSTSVALAAYVAIGRSQQYGIVDDLIGDNTGNDSWLGAKGFHQFVSIQRAGHPMANDDCRRLLDTICDAGQPLYVRVMAVETLGRCGLTDASAVSQVIKLIASPDQVLANTAKQALQNVDVASDQCIGPIAAGLLHSESIIRHESARALKRFRGRAAPACIDLCKALRRADGNTDQYLVAAFLDVIRSMGCDGAAAADTIVELLAENSQLYANRDKQDVARLRAYMLLTLSDTTVPRSAIPYLIDSVVNIDDLMLPYELGAAARAVGSMGTAGRPFATYLASALEKQFHNNQFSLERFDPVYPAHESTTVQFEILCALKQIQPVNDQQVIHAVIEFKKGLERSPDPDRKLLSVAKSTLDICQPE